MRSGHEGGDITSVPIAAQPLPWPADGARTASRLTNRSLNSIKTLSRVACFAAALCSGAGAAELCGRQVTSFEQIRDEIVNDPHLKPSPRGGADFLAYDETGPTRQWFVTKPDFPDVKAVVCRALEEDKGQFFIKTETRCFGSDAPCAKLSRAFGTP